MQLCSYSTGGESEARGAAGPCQGHTPSLPELGDHEKPLPLGYITARILDWSGSELKAKKAQAPETAGSLGAPVTRASAGSSAALWR